MSVESVAASIARKGQTIILRRVTGAGHQATFDVECKAMVRNYQPHELAGGIVQGDREVRVSNKEISARQWPGPPLSKRDRAVIDGREVSVEAVNTLRLGEEIAMHILQVRG
jgi:hypothetical protein